MKKTSNAKGLPETSLPFRGTGGITERLLQFIWQFQYYNINELQTSTGESIQVVSPGQLNSNQGPDFINARIRIGKTLWAGTVEIHINSSDWKKHRHQSDKNYNNVVLHVVWQNDYPESYEEEKRIPVLELKSRVSKIFLKRYEELMQSSSFIPCEKKRFMLLK